MTHGIWRYGICSLVATAALAGSAAAQPDVTVVMSGLDNPRGLAFGPDGGLYVTEAGRGGDGPCVELRGEDHCFGPTGALSRLLDGVQTRVVTGLPSHASPAEATGPHDVAFADGAAVVLVGLGADPAVRPAFGPDGATFGTLLALTDGGGWEVVADIAAHEAAENPDGGPIDSNPFSLLATPDGYVVPDAGANALFGVDAAGVVSTLAVFPPTVATGSESVPTSAVVGPDGAYYVGELTGAPFADGAARIFRVVPGEAPDVVHDGFKTIIDLAFGPDGSLYVLQFATGDPFFAEPGQVIRVDADGTRSVVIDGLIAPTSLLIDASGTFYVTNHGTAPGEGEVLQVTTPYVRHYAEGAVGSFFDTAFALVNPGEASVAASLRFANDSGQVVAHELDVPAAQQVTVDVASVVPAGWVGLATTIEADGPLVTSRTMRWGAGGYGSDSGAGVVGPRTEWWITEGATGVFSLFYLLHNPGATEAEVEVTYFRGGGLAPVTRTHTVGAETRQTLFVNSADGITDDPELGDTTISARIVATNGVPVVVERAMYLTTSPAQPFTAGTVAAAVPQPTTRWTFAEGATGFFNLFLLLANPSDAPVEATVQYLRPAGDPIERVYTLAPSSRHTVWVNGEDAELESTTVAIDVEAGAPILAERAMWWGAAGPWDAGHVSTGTGQPARRWGLAGFGATAGETGYVLVANPGAQAAEVRLTRLFEDDTAPVQVTVPLAAGSRATLQLESLFPTAAGAPAAVLVESVGAVPVPIVVEGAAYASPDGQPLGTGRTVPALPLAELP